jgi:nicrotizing toxin Mtb-like protein
MRVMRHVLIVLMSLLFLLTGTASVGLAATPTSVVDDKAAPPCPTEHRAPPGISTPPTPHYPQEYFLDDWRLGPKELPKTPPIGPMLVNYQRTDAMTAPQFLSCYWNDQIHGWWFPDNDGFLLDDNGQPIKRTQTLRPGQLVDLFGTGAGHFLAPAGTRYAERALPPSNLDTIENAFPFGYHLYEVVQPFDVQAGPIRPWFGQPGLGLQYLTSDTIPSLVASGFLKTLN